jgi:hypothetical protein
MSQEKLGFTNTIGTCLTKYLGAEQVKKFGRPYFERKPYSSRFEYESQGFNKWFEEWPYKDGAQKKNDGKDEGRALFQYCKTQDISTTAALLMSENPIIAAIPEVTKREILKAGIYQRLVREYDDTYGAADYPNAKKNIEKIEDLLRDLDVKTGAEDQTLVNT